MHECVTSLVSCISIRTHKIHSHTLYYPKISKFPEIAAKLIENDLSLLLLSFQHCKPQKRKNQKNKITPTTFIQTKKTKQKKNGLPHTESTTMATENPIDLDPFGLQRRTLPIQPPPPLTRLSLNGNASVLLSMADINSRMMTHSPHSSKSNDAIYSQDISTITTSRRATSTHHFNIDELYIKNQPMIRRNMGKRGIIVALSIGSQHTH